MEAWGVKIASLSELREGWGARGGGGTHGTREPKLVLYFRDVPSLGGGRTLGLPRLPCFLFPSPLLQRELKPVCAGGGKGFSRPGVDLPCNSHHRPGACLHPSLSSWPP